MRNITLLMIFFSFTITQAQHQGSGDCELYPVNKKWISSFKKARSTDKKISMVVNKVFWDADYFYVDPEFVETDRNQLDVIPCSEDCSLRIGIVYGKNEGIVLDLNKNPALEELLYELSSENIQKVELNEYRENDVYGLYTDKRSGIVLYTNSKELKKMIRRLPKPDSE